MAHIPPPLLLHQQQQPLQQSQLQSNPNNEQYKIAYPPNQNQQYVHPQGQMHEPNSPHYNQYYQPAANGNGGHEGLDPSAMVVQLGHNPSRNQLRKPWWIWAIAVADILIAILFAARVGYTIVTHDVFIADRDTLMWVFFLLFLSLAVQFMMGVGLILCLLAPDESTTIWYLQGWLCGAYFLIGETGVVLLGSILKLRSGGDDVGTKLLLVSLKTCFRVISFILVRRYLNNIKKRTMNQMAEAEHQQHQLFMHHLHCQRQEQVEHHRQQQEIQQQEELLRLQQQLQQQQLQNTPPPPSSAPPSGGSGSNNHEYFYYAPQMSYMMSMMMNNSSTT